MKPKPQGKHWRLTPHKGPIGGWLIQHGEWGDARSVRMTGKPRSQFYVTPCTERHFASETKAREAFATLEPRL